MNLRTKISQHPRPISKVASIPSTMSVQPKNAVRIPTIHSKPGVQVFRVQTKKQPVVSVKSKIGSRPKANVAAPMVTVRKRSLTNVRPSHLRKSHDAILGKHSDLIRSLRDSGRGRILVIIACGPSANQVNFEKILKHPKIDIMCINKPDLRVWPSRYWIFCDQSQYNRNQEYWAPYHGTIINAASVRAAHPNQILIRTLAGKGFSRDLTKGFHIGRSTTYAAMQVALYMDYNLVYIFGCDMGEVDGCLHRYGQNPDVSNENRLKRFDKEAENYDWAIKNMHIDECGKFRFCSSYNHYGFVDKFGRLDQRTAHNDVLFKANELLTQKEAELANIQKA